MLKTSRILRNKPRPVSDRASETRARLIHSGLVLFGQQGFDATTTRALAERAKANLAAIPYHFGGKDGLYAAVASHLVNEIRARILSNPALAAAIAAPPASPQEARALIHLFLDRMADVIVGGSDAELWAPFLLREQMSPTAAFDILYEGLMEPLLKGLSACVAVATGSRPAAQETSIRAFTLFGQIIAFRAARSAVKRTLGWRHVGEPELSALKAVLHVNIDAILDAGQCS